MTWIEYNRAIESSRGSHSYSSCRAPELIESYPLMRQGTQCVMSWNTVPGKNHLSPYYPTKRANTVPRTTTWWPITLLSRPTSKHSAWIAHPIKKTQPIPPLSRPTYHRGCKCQISTCAKMSTSIQNYLNNLQNWPCKLLCESKEMMKLNDLVSEELSLDLSLSLDPSLRSSV